MNIIYVDDEKPAIDNFRLTVKNFKEIDTLNTFQNGEEALAFARENIVDATGYLMKPYTAAEIHKELAKCTY